MISITEIAKQFNISIRTIRYYEQIGLIEKSKRVSGKRYFQENTIINDLNEILFLKSLNFSLKDVKKALTNPYYIKVILINIRIELIRMEIESLLVEKNNLKKLLEDVGWIKVTIENKDILNSLSKESYNMIDLIEDIDVGFLSFNEAKKFVEIYKKWHAKCGFKITDKNINILAKFPNKTGIYDEKLSSILKKYCEN